MNDSGTHERENSDLIAQYHGELHEPGVRACPLGSRSCARTNRQRHLETISTNNRGSSCTSLALLDDARAICRRHGPAPAQRRVRRSTHCGCKGLAPCGAAGWLVVAGAAQRMWRSVSVR